MCNRASWGRGNAQSSACNYEILRPNMAWSESEIEDSVPNTRTQTKMHLSWTYIRTAELAIWGVGPDVKELTVFNVSILLESSDRSGQVTPPFSALRCWENEPDARPTSTELKRKLLYLLQVTTNIIHTHLMCAHEYRYMHTNTHTCTQTHIHAHKHVHAH